MRLKKESEICKVRQSKFGVFYLFQIQRHILISVTTNILRSEIQVKAALRLGVTRKPQL